MRMSGTPGKSVLADPPRAALKFDALVIVEDSLVPLRRQRKG
jgi:hypothetical protein